MKFKLVVMNLVESDRPEESSWPVVLLEIFMPHSIDWPSKIRVEKIYEIQVFIMEIENALKANESNCNEHNEFVESNNDSVQIMSPSDDNASAKSQARNECSESINNENQSSDCEQESQFNESEDCNQQEDGYEIENQFCDSEYECEEVCDNSGDFDCLDEIECYDDFDISEFDTNVAAVAMSSSFHLDNSHNQERICEEIFLSPDEISKLLAREFGKFVSISKDVRILPHSFSSFGQVNSPIFDVERYII